MSHSDTLLDWPKLFAQYSQPALLADWLAQVLEGLAQEQQLLNQASDLGEIQVAQRIQLQGLAAVVCSPRLTYLLEQSKHSDPAQHPELIAQCQACLTAIKHELQSYLQQQ
ncbi:hypothetical protein [Aliagarivorans taiwanensis]|uniref:hypothetical protein n=1 Tax=Aliagarivorans taiwanensis TaxID=561966 RepID=UPI00040BFCC0|nr:hypothetical protein [Aliagarivorans taiwanensis]